MKTKKQILTPRQAVEIAQKMLLDKFKEHFIVILTDSRRQLISAEIVSIGTLDASLVHPREVFRPAIVKHCSSILILHNHPSGEIDPSEQDNKVTARLIKAGEILGIELTDHIIFTSGEKYSSMVADGNFTSLKMKNY